MNRQTKRLHALGVSTFVHKGVNGTGEADNPQLGFKSFPFGHQPRKKKSARGVRTVVHEPKEAV